MIFFFGHAFILLKGVAETHKVLGPSVQEFVDVRIVRPVRSLRWIPKTVVTATLICAGVELVAQTRLHALAEGARLALAVVYVVTVWACARAPRRGRWLMVASAMLIGVGLFASELSALHLPGIWFPYGTGVSRTQFAYAGADITLALLFWRMLAPQRITA